MDLDITALRKLAAGLIALILASGLIKNKFIEKNKWAKIFLYFVGAILIISAILYQFNFIPEEHTDVLLKGESKPNESQ